MSSRRIELHASANEIIDAAIQGFTEARAQFVVDPSGANLATMEEFRGTLQADANRIVGAAKILRQDTGENVDGIITKTALMRALVREMQRMIGEAACLRDVG